MPATTDVSSDLQHFELVVLDQLRQAGLPDDDVFVDVPQRRAMLMNAPGVLAGMSPEQRARSPYISKMIAAVSVGLFDAALNYLWDETVTELRRRVAGFDLSYFFDIAAPAPEVRKKLKSADDLSKIDDASLLRASREIDLLTEVGYQQLDHIRFMRNHASAAHPNQVELTGLSLANWLETCIRQVMTTPMNTVTAETGKLLGNIRKKRLTAAEVDAAAAFFDQLPGDRPDTLANGLFGLYTAPDATPEIADNVRTLWPELWPFVGEDTRRSFGVKYARFGANADTGQAAAARELIDLVDGSAYLLEETRAAELDAALDALIAAHNGWNNFSAEAGPAAQVEALVGDQGNVPEAVARKYVRTVVECFFGNPYGVSWAGEQIYRRLLERLDSRAASRALRAFTNESISSLLRYDIPRGQWAELLDILEPKVTRRSDRELMGYIRAFTGTPDQLRLDSQARKLSALKVRRPSTEESA